MEKDFHAHMGDLFSLTDEIIQVCRKIESLATLDKQSNAENGKWEFAYVEYYLKEIVSLLELSIYLQSHESFRKIYALPSSFNHGDCFANGACLFCKKQERSKGGTTTAYERHNQKREIVARMARRERKGNDSNLHASIRCRSKNFTT